VLPVAVMHSITASRTTSSSTRLEHLTDGRHHYIGKDIDQAERLRHGSTLGRLLVRTGSVDVTMRQHGRRVDL